VRPRGRATPPNRPEVLSTRQPDVRCLFACRLSIEEVLVKLICNDSQSCIFDVDQYMRGSRA
jgi:hypothetical protein